MVPKQNKYYVDPSMYLDADAVARQAQAMFPKVRFGVGPAALNANFDGDANVMAAHLSNLPVGGAGAKAADARSFVPASPAPVREELTPAEAIHYNDGDSVFVLSLGIEGKVKNVLPHGIVNVELADGITETMLAKNLEPVQKAATNPLYPWYRSSRWS